MNPRSFSIRIGANDGTTRMYIDRGSKPSSDYLEKIVRSIDGVNANWLLTGEGEMFTTDLNEAINAANDPFYIKQVQLSDNEIHTLKRLVEVISFLGEKQNISFEEVCAKTGLTKFQFSFLERITLDQLINVCNTYLINAHWLLTGKGEKFSDENPIVDISITKLNLLVENFDFFEKQRSNIANTLYDLNFSSKYSKKKLFAYFNYFEQIDLKKITELKNKSIEYLTESDLNIIGLERSFDDRDLINLFYTKDFNDSKLYFNKVGDKFELRGFQWPSRDDFGTEEDFLIALEELNRSKKSEYDSETKWKKYRIAKLKDILTTEELINEVFRWKFK